MFCVLYAVSGRLWVPIGVHLTWNLAQLPVRGDGLRRRVWPQAPVFALIMISSVTAGVLPLTQRGRTERAPGGDVGFDAETSVRATETPRIR